MWQIESVQAKNFFSYKELKYKIVNNELTMIYGQNKDVSEKKSNGSGKSVLLDIIAFAITGDCLRKIKSSKKIISNGEKECYAQIELENKILKKNLKICRTLSIKSSQKISIFLNDKECNELKDLHTRESEKFIEEQLGVSFSDITNYYLISKFKYQSLFLANDTTKKDVINRFSQANIIDSIFKYIDDDLNDQNLTLQGLQNSLIKNKTTIELYEKQLEELIADQSDDKKKEDISIIQAKIDQRKKVIDQSKFLIIELYASTNIVAETIKNKKQQIINEAELKKYDKTIDDINLSLTAKRLQYTQLRDKYKTDFALLDSEEIECKQSIKELEKNVKEFEKSIKELESYIAGEIECPKCKHHFILADSDFDIEEAKENIKALEVEKNKDEDIFKNINIQLQKLKQDREQLNNEIRDEEKVLQLKAANIKVELDKIENQKLELTRSNNNILSEISELERQVKTKEQAIKLNDDNILNEKKYIEQYNKEIEEVQKNKNDVTIRQQTEKIEGESSKGIEIQDDIDLLIVKIAKITEWEKKFKRFKSFLANQSISQIQQQSNYFLKKMKCDMFVFIDGFRELSNGKLKEEITVELSRDGLEGEEFGAFSGGEKSVADLACILSMQNIINSTSHSGGLNFLGIDEILESVDSEGMDEVSKCLSQLNQTVLLIAHSQPNQLLDVNKLIIEKRNSISKII